MIFLLKLSPLIGPSNVKKAIGQCLKSIEY